MPQTKIAYAGMTHLGLCSAIAAASRGFPTLGFAQDAALIDRLERGNLPISEPDIDDMLRNSHSRIAFTSDPRRLGDCDLIYVAPDVPTDDSGKSDLGSIEAMLDVVLSAIRPDAVVAILSQVPPGFTRSHTRPGVNLLYQVETLVFGRAMERATKPERFIVGCAEPEQPLPPAMRSYLEAFGCPILPMRFESAELAKIAINCCLVSSISVANTLAELCEGVGAVWSEIVPALKLDLRIGRYSYLAPGLGIAGGNLERDLATVCRIAEGIGSDDSVVRAWLSNSRHRRDWPLRVLRHSVLEHAIRPLIAVLGLAYKENTDSIKNSPSVALLSKLQEYEVVTHDPVVPVSAIAHLNTRAAKTPLECSRGADVLMIMTPWPQYRLLDPAELAAVMRGNVVVDPYSVLDPRACQRVGLDLHALGVPHVTLYN